MENIALEDKHFRLPASELVGMVNDALEPRFGEMNVRYSLLIIGVFHVWAALHNALAARTLQRDLAKTADGP